MPIRKDDTPPNRRFGLVNLLLIGFGVLLLLSSFLPNQGMQQVPRVPYSLFVSQVDDGNVRRAYITQEQIRYELKSPPEDDAPSVLATTPIFDMDLPKRLEEHGVEFAAAPPQKPSFITTALSWIVPPLIFILVLQFFARRSMGGAQGALSFTKSKAKVYVPDEESRITFADVAGVDEAKQELTEIVDFLKSSERYTAIGARIPKGVLLVGPPAQVRPCSRKRSPVKRVFPSSSSAAQSSLNSSLAPVPPASGTCLKRPRKKHPASSSSTNSMRSARAVRVRWASSAATTNASRPSTSCSPRWTALLPRTSR